MPNNLIRPEIIRLRKVCGGGAGRDGMGQTFLACMCLCIYIHM